MMISPEMYYDEHLRGKSKEEILREIRSLKREINRLKRELEDDSMKSKVQMMPSPLTQIRCNRDYLEMAKKAYEEAGGTYQPTEEEQKDQAFNEALAYMKRLDFYIGGYSGGREMRVYHISGDRVVCDRRCGYA
ncbi:MAG: hypothetical protein IJR36_09250, partial [Lachnospiraceae bacterium]|nr:hypothetical protein [Lachnospiraceae bacterium]